MIKKLIIKCLVVLVFLLFCWSLNLNFGSTALYSRLPTEGDVEQQWSTVDIQVLYM